MDKFSDICIEYQQDSSLAMFEVKPFEALFLATDTPPVFVDKTSLKYFEDWSTTVEIRTGLYEKSKKQRMFISTKIY